MSTEPQGQTAAMRKEFFYLNRIPDSGVREVGNILSDNCVQIQFAFFFEFDQNIFSFF